MEVLDLRIDDRGRLTLPADIRRLLDWRTGDKVRVIVAEPTPDNVIADSLILVNLGRRERTTDKEVPLGDTEA